MIWCCAAVQMGSAQARHDADWAAFDMLMSAEALRPIIAPRSPADSKAESGGARNFVKKSNLREDPIPPLPFCWMSLGHPVW